MTLIQDRSQLPPELSNIFNSEEVEQEIQLEEYETFEDRDNSQNDDAEDEDDMDNMKIDEVEKVDNNLKVDEEFQISLNERINELSMKDSNHTHSLLMISRPTVNYNYDDKIDMKQELNEWFTSDETTKLIELRYAFMKHFPLVQEGTAPFISLSQQQKHKIITQLAHYMVTETLPMRLDMLKSILYLALGAFEGSLVESCDDIKQIVNLLIIDENGLIRSLVDLMKESFNNLRFSNENIVMNSNALYLTLSILYVCILSKLDSKDEDIGFKVTLDSCNLLDFLTKSIDVWRWDCKASLRIRNIIILLTKSFQLIIGDLTHKTASKNYLREKFNIKKDTEENKLTNSPIEYHIFRQELISRYPSYIPPPSQVPTDTCENSQSLTQFITNPKNLSMSTLLPKRHNTRAQPPLLHIATPVPSPPLSPQNTGPVGNRFMKNKRSFQTNTNYPLIFPVENNNSDEVPKSIKEASELFNSRVVEKLSLKQLWNECDLFIRYEKRFSEGVNNESEDKKQQQQHYYSEEMFEYFHEDDDINQPFINSLNRVEEYYHDTLPNLSSMVQVFLQILTNSNEDSINIENCLKEGNHPNKQLEVLIAKQTLVKNVSYVIRLVLEWFKVSHILKFEYFSSLIHDSAFSELVLNQFKDISAKHRINYNKNNGDLIGFKKSIWSTKIDSQASAASTGNQGQAPDTTYIFTQINLFSILSHITMKKPHRLQSIISNDKDPSDSFHNILTIYNSSLWTPVLHVIKTLVSISGKKWKSNNMDLISLIYLNLKMNLSDNWLMGRDLDVEAHEGHLQEVALRALVKFYNERKYTVHAGEY